MIILRVFFHTILIMLILNIFVLAMKEQPVPVLTGVLAWIQWQSFFLFSLSCAMAMNNQPLLFLAIFIIIMLANLHKPGSEILPILTSAGIGFVLGHSLQGIIRQAQPPARNQQPTQQPPQGGRNA